MVRRFMTSGRSRICCCKKDAQVGGSATATRHKLPVHGDRDAETRRRNRCRSPLMTNGRCQRRNGKPEATHDEAIGIAYHRTSRASTSPRNKPPRLAQLSNRPSLVSRPSPASGLGKRARQPSLGADFETPLCQGLKPNETLGAPMTTIGYARVTAIFLLGRTNKSVIVLLIAAKQTTTALTEPLLMT
jgi:hypothetical protein